MRWMPSRRVNDEGLDTSDRVCYSKALLAFRFLGVLNHGVGHRIIYYNLIIVNKERRIYQNDTVIKT